MLIYEYGQITKKLGTKEKQNKKKINKKGKFCGEKMVYTDGAMRPP